MIYCNQLQRPPEIWSTISHRSFSVGLNMKSQVDWIKIKIKAAAKHE